MIYTGPELKKAYPTDAGFDLVSPAPCILPPRGRLFIETETQIVIPSTHVGLVCPRSGLGKKGIGIVNAPGIIDSGYTGKIGVTLINHTDEPYEIRKDDRIAQLVVVEVSSWAARIEPEDFEKVAASCQRGENGFGSSGR